METLRKHLRLASAFALCLFLGSTVAPAAASDLVGSSEATDVRLGSTIEETAFLSAALLGVASAARLATAAADALMESLLIEIAYDGEDTPGISTSLQAGHDAMDFSSFDH